LGEPCWNPRDQVINFGEKRFQYRRCVDPHRAMLLDLAIKHRLVLMSSSRETTAAGGVISISANFLALYEQAALYVDKIIKGAKPANLPVEQPTKFQVVLNMKTARVLGLTISPTLLAQADEVIE
jgi:putative tryptophan/tyrosine transport system substrate-binding protein